MPFAVVLPEPSESKKARRRLSRWVLFWSIASVALSAIIYMWIYIAGPSLESLFRGFSDDLPWFTSIVLATYKFYGLLLLVGVVPCAILWKERNSFVRQRIRLIKLVMAGFGLALTSLAVFVTAAYLPVFQVGSSMQ